MVSLLKLRSVLFFISVLLFSILLFTDCADKFPENKSIGDKSYSLINQDSRKVIFPRDFKGKIVVMSFIYTNCPDICPLTTHNMQTIQAKIKSDNIKNIQFVELSFDPDRDTPSVLKEYGNIRNVDYSNFEFLTGKKSVVDTLLHHMNVIAIQGDTTLTKSGTPIYFFTHTDRITLIDKDGRIRNEYRGSKANTAEIVNDIKILGD